MALPHDSARKQYSISFSAGVSAPLSAFGNKTNAIQPTVDSIRTMNSGYANTGFYFRLSGSYLFTDYLGLRIAYSGSFNSFDIAGFSNANNLSSSDNVSASKSFYTGQVLVGPYISISLSNKLTLEPVIMGGMIASSYPTITVSNVSSGTTNTQTLSLHKGTTLGYDLGISANYTLSSNFTIGIHADYVRTDMHYPGYDFRDSWNTYYTTSSAIRMLTMALLQAGVLVSYNFQAN